MPRASPCGNDWAVMRLAIIAMRLIPPHMPPLHDHAWPTEIRHRNPSYTSSPVTDRSRKSS